MVNAIQKRRVEGVSDRAYPERIADLKRMCSRARSKTVVAVSLAMLGFYMVAIDETIADTERQVETARKGDGK